MDKQRAEAAALLAAGCLASALHLLITQPAWFNDSDEYLYLAELLQGAAPAHVEGLGPVYYREIGFPFLLSVLNVKNNGLLPLWLIQWAMAAVTPLLLYLSLATWTRYAALLGCAYLASFASVLNTHSVLRDTLLNFMMALLLLGFSLLVQRGSSPFRWAFFITASLVAVAMKATFILALVPLVGCIWISGFSWRSAIGGGLCAAAVVTVLAVSGTPIEKHSIIGRLTFWQVWGAGQPYARSPVDINAPCTGALHRSMQAAGDTVGLIRARPSLGDWYRLWWMADAILGPAEADKVFLCAAGEVVVGQPLRATAYLSNLFDALVMPDVSYFLGKRKISLMPMETQSDYRGLPTVMSPEITASLEKSGVPRALVTAYWYVAGVLLWLARIGALVLLLFLLPRVISMRGERLALALGALTVFTAMALSIAAFAAAGSRLTSTLLLPLILAVGVCLSDTPLDRDEVNSRLRMFSRFKGKR